MNNDVKCPQSSLSSTDFYFASASFRSSLLCFSCRLLTHWAGFFFLYNSRFIRSSVDERRFFILFAVRRLNGAQSSKKWNKNCHRRKASSKSKLTFSNRFDAQYNSMNLLCQNLRATAIKVKNNFCHWKCSHRMVNVACRIWNTWCC